MFFDNWRQWLNRTLRKPRQVPHRRAARFRPQVLQLEDRVVPTLHQLVDLEIVSNNDAPDPVSAGNSIAYTISFINNGPDTATDVTVTDLLPAGTTFDSAAITSGTGWDLVSPPAVPGSVQFANASVASGATASFTITVIVPAGTAAGTNITNTATAGTAGPNTLDTNGSNDAKSALTTVITQADLSIAKAGPATAVVGAAAGFDYTFTVTNSGPSNNSGGFTVTDLLPAGTTFQSAGSTPGASVNGRTVTYTNSSGLVVGASQTFTIHVTLSQGGSVLQNTATVASDGTLDPVSANNTSNTVSTVAIIGDGTLSYRQNTLTVNVPPGSLASIAGSSAFYLDRDLGLAFIGNFIQNFAGMNERWLRGNGNAFGNPWYFIKPNGQLFQWDGTPAALGSTLVGTLEPIYYTYPDLLYNASQGTVDLVIKQRLALVFTGNFSQNYGGRNEKWLRGIANEFGTPWYFIDTGGRLYAWDGAANQATGTLLADLDTLFWAQPERLYNAQANEVTATVVGNVLTLQTIPNWAGPVVVEIGSAIPAPSHEMFTLSWVNHAPQLTPSGDQTRQAGQPPLNLTLNASDADTDTLTFSALGGHLGFTLQQSLGLRLQGSLVLNYGGQNEKWLQSALGNWYFIKPNGQFFLWDGTPSQATGALTATLDPIYYHRPDLLYNPPAGDLALALDQRLGLNATSTNLSINYGGQNEKWVLGTDGWYFVKPNGEFWKWNGASQQATGTRMATLSVDYYTNMQRLYDAQPNQVAINLTGNTLTLTPASGFIGDFWITVKVNDGSNLVYQQFKLTVTP